jgi:prepilin-type N-terminal cleavage/methylation domain-containing protein
MSYPSDAVAFRLHKGAGVKGGRTQRGMTILELMVVVVIIGVLAAVAVVAYKRYIRSAHASEVPLVFGELRIKQEQYAAENAGVFVDEANPYPGTAASAVDTEVAVRDDAGAYLVALPAGWVSLRVNVPKAALYCDYTTRAGTSADDPAAVAGNFDGLYSGAMTMNWYFVYAECNFSDGANNSEYFQRGDLPSLHDYHKGE